MQHVVQIKKLTKEAKLPVKATEGSVGYDLHADISALRKDPGKTFVTIWPGTRLLVPCGFALAMPSNLEAQIRSRSGLAFKNGVFVLNSPGTIDPDYRGEIGALLFNAGNMGFVINQGDRIAQMVFNTFISPKSDLVEILSESERGEGGFGSTGVA